ncbi:universal stress protein [Taklimakanibacter lacteus]|uniref:universal stress protein n=1 Tax=Taklimakanibacter lacteus TaxID=2268456 RepID=UPI000E665E18
MREIRNIENILIGLTVESKAEPTAAVSYGLSLAKQAHAQVTVYAPSTKLVLPHAFVSGTAAGIVAAENRHLEELAREAVKRIEAEARAARVAASVHSPQLKRLKLVEDFTKEARLHDLIILDTESQAIDIDRDLIEAALLDSGRPLIVVPAEHKAFSARHVVVAWDGSNKAARALFDALPLLRVAQTIEVVQVVGEKDLTNAIPGSALVAHLLAHGVQIEAKTIAARDGDVADALRQYAERSAVDLIVMGGFAHARIRQLILGGVTQSLLRHCDVPLFLSH